MYEHIVIGAGINGSSAAYQLARRGRKVLLLEKVVTRIIDFKLCLTFGFSVVPSSSQQRQFPWPEPGHQEGLP